MKKLKRIAASIVVLFSIFVLVACGTASQIQQATRIIITAHDYSFEGPTQIEAGPTSITLQNQSQEPHHVQLVRLTDGVSPEQFRIVLQEGTEAALPLMTWVGGPGVVDPGRSQEVAMELTAGTYLLLCFVPGPEGVPYLAKGMVASLEVVARQDQIGVQSRGDGRDGLLRLCFAAGDQGRTTGLAMCLGTSDVTHFGSLRGADSAPKSG